MGDQHFGAPLDCHVVAGEQLDARVVVVVAGECTATSGRTTAFRPRRAAAAPLRAHLTSIDPGLPEFCNRPGRRRLIFVRVVGHASVLPRASFTQDALDCALADTVTFGQFDER